MNLDLDNDYAPPPPPKAKSGVNGCLVAVVIVVALVVFGAWYVVSNLKNLAADFVGGALAAMIESADIPKDQKVKLVKRVTQLKEDYKSGKVNEEQLGQIMTNVAEGPIFPMGMVMAIDQNYVQPSGLSDDEKADARRTLERVARGIYEKKLKSEELDLSSVSTVDAEGNRQLKQNITDDELREFLKGVKAKADEAGIPDEPFIVDLAGEFDRAIAEVMEQ